MRKSVVFLLVLVLLAGAAVLLWSVNRQRAPRLTAVSVDSAAIRSQGSMQPVKSLAPATVSSPALHPKLLQVSVADTSILERKTADWWSTRGCDSSETLRNIGTPINTLRSKVLNNDLTAVNALAAQLISDVKADGRPAAKPILWQAMLQGSVCAIANYYFTLVNWRRTVRKGAHGKLEVHYALVIPATTAGKRASIMQAYAWDLLYQMRTGGITSTPITAYSVEWAYHFDIRPTPAEYVQACEKATALYDQLQAARDAAGYGPFDNSPPPIQPEVKVSAFGPDQPPACAHWPVPVPRCEPAKLHEIVRSGVIYPQSATVCLSSDSTSN
ncbi:MAG: hypothetical protein ACRETQ_08860 [Gammaproteobacteria bacterium]